MYNVTSVHFNYIITIHNKQSLIRDVILHVIRCMDANSTLYPVLDGCTDDSEKIIDVVSSENPHVRVIKVYANDVHELKSINAGLKAASQEGNGFNIILQDDVLLNDSQLQEKIAVLYGGIENLGIVSFRHGANLSRRILAKKAPILPYKAYTESVKGHRPNPFTLLPEGYFTFREIAIKSPICIPFSVIRKLGTPDEAYAPWDDMEYCYRVSEGGFDNGVFAVDIISDAAWGTTRTKSQKMSNDQVHSKNITLFKKTHGITLAKKRPRRNYRSAPFRIFVAITKPHRISAMQYSQALRIYVYVKAKYIYTILFSK